MDGKICSNLVVMDGFLADPSNYSFRIRGMNEQLQVTYASVGECKFTEVSAYYRNLSHFPYNILTAKDDYALGKYRAYHVEIGQNLHPIQFDDAVSSIQFKLDVVPHLKARWSSVVYLDLPSLGEPFPIYLNYSMEVPDIFPFMPNFDGMETSLFQHLNVSVDRTACLDFVEMGDYERSKLPEIVFFDKQGHRTSVSSENSAMEYFTAVLKFYDEYVLKCYLSGEHLLSTVILLSAFEVLEKHILKSLKAAVTELIKRSPPLCIPTSEHLFLLACGASTNSTKRKVKYDQISDYELLSLGKGSIEVKSQVRPCEWVECRIDDQIYRRVKIKAINDKGTAIYQVKEFRSSTKL